MSSDLFPADPGRLERSLDYLDWSLIAGAVADVFADIKACERQTGLQASADRWGLFDVHRAHLFEAVRAAWCRRAGLEWAWFPYGVDAVVRLYFRFRKRNPDEVKGFREEIEARFGLWKARPRRREET